MTLRHLVGGRGDTGDIVLKVNGKATNTVGQFMHALGLYKPHCTINLLVRRALSSKEESIAVSPAALT